MVDKHALARSQIPKTNEVLVDGDIWALWEVVQRSFTQTGESARVMSGLVLVKRILTLC